METNKAQKPEYIENQVNNNCQQFFGTVTGCVFAMPGSNVGMPNAVVEKATVSTKTLEERILAVYRANLCKNKADWGIVFRLLRELGRFKPTEYYECAELINTTCGEVLTDEDSIRLSKPNLSLRGSYKTGWQDTKPTVQTESLLKRYNEIADVFMQD